MIKKISTKRKNFGDYEYFKHHEVPTVKIMTSDDDIRNAVKSFGGTFFLMGYRSKHSEIYKPYKIKTNVLNYNHTDPTRGPKTYEGDIIRGYSIDDAAKIALKFRSMNDQQLIDFERKHINKILMSRPDYYALSEDYKKDVLKEIALRGAIRVFYINRIEMLKGGNVTYVHINAQEPQNKELLPVSESVERFRNMPQDRKDRLEMIFSLKGLLPDGYEELPLIEKERLVERIYDNDEWRTASNLNKRLKISKSDWLNIGKKFGWMR